jgi:hypothetical protein
MFEIRDGKVFLSAEEALNLQWVEKARVGNRSDGLRHFTRYVRRLPDGSLQASDGIRIHKVYGDEEAEVQEEYLKCDGIDRVRIRSHFVEEVGYSFPCRIYDDIEGQIDLDKLIIDPVEGVHILVNAQYLRDALNMPEQTGVVRLTVSDGCNPIKIEEWDDYEGKPGKHVAVIMPIG